MTDESLARRMASLEAIEAIKALKHRYFRACDAKDLKSFRECFRERGAFVDLGPLGQFENADTAAEAFAAATLGTANGRFSGYDMHHGVHPDITVHSATAATGQWSLRMRHVNVTGRMEVLLAAEYHDDYVVENGQWKISRSVLTVLWSLRRPLPDGAQVEGFEGPAQ